MSSLVSNPAAQEKLKRVVQRIYDLPSFPDVIQKLQEEAESPTSTAKKLAAVMEKDQGLSAKVLKLVNSAFYSFSKPVSSLQHAITLLGYNSIRSLAMSVSVRSALSVDSECFDAEKFWDHALGVATATRQLAELGRFTLKEDAFTAGLLHDVGILLVAKYFPEELEVIGAKVAEGLSLQEAELDVLGVDHSILGGWLAEQWRLPPMLQAPMLRHTAIQASPVDDEERNQLPADVMDVLQFVATADLIVNSLGMNHSLDGPGATDAEFELPAHLQGCLSGNSLAEVISGFRERFEASRAFLTV